MMVGRAFSEPRAKTRLFRQKAHSRDPSIVLPGSFLRCSAINITRYTILYHTHLFLSLVSLTAFVQRLKHYRI